MNRLEAADQPIPSPPHGPISIHQTKPPTVSAYQLTEDCLVQLGPAEFMVVPGKVGDWVILRDDESPMRVLTPAEFEAEFEA